MFWVDKADFEVSGFGKCIFNGTDFEVIDAILLKQEGGAAHTDIDATSLSKVQYLLREQPGELRFWWHSHVDMPTFMSHTDEKTLKELGANGWAIASVFNKKREITSAVSYKYDSPFGTPEIYYDAAISTQIQYPGLTEADKEELTKQFDENVKKESYNNLWPQQQYWGDGQTSQGAGYLPTDYYSTYERECSTALGISVNKFRNKINKANEAELSDLAEEIQIYWLTQRGYSPIDYSGDYDNSLGIFDQMTNERYLDAANGVPNV